MEKSENLNSKIELLENMIKKFNILSERKIDTSDVAKEIATFVIDTFNNVGYKEGKGSVRATLKTELTEALKRCKSLKAEYCIHNGKIIEFAGLTNENGNIIARKSVVSTYGKDITSSIDELARPLEYTIFPGEAEQIKPLCFDEYAWSVNTPDGITITALKDKLFVHQTKESEIEKTNTQDVNSIINIFNLRGTEYLCRTYGPEELKSVSYVNSSNDGVVTRITPTEISVEIAKTTKTFYESNEVEGMGKHDLVKSELEVAKKYQIKVPVSFMELDKEAIVLRRGNLKKLLEQITEGSLLEKAEAKIKLSGRRVVI